MIAESYWRSFQLPVAIIRPFNTFGPRQSARAVIPTIISQALEGGPIKLGSLAPTRDMNYVDNTVDAFLAVGTHGAAIGQVINIGSGREASVGEIAQLILNMVGGKSRDRRRSRANTSRRERGRAFAMQQRQSEETARMVAAGEPRGGPSPHGRLVFSASRSLQDPDLQHLRTAMRAVILAGGKGQRLRPYTTVLPKPLMPIGDMPILEVVLRQLRHAGITRVTMAVGYLAELLQAFFGDGRRLGLEIDYSFEERPLGTVGPLTLIPGLKDEGMFLMMNGDLLTTLDYQALIAHHRSSAAAATIATYRREVKIDFGVVETDDQHLLTGYVEKPSFQFRVSMGIYCFDARVLAMLKHSEHRDFPDLIKSLIAAGENVASYPFEGYWLDIGRPDDYATAIEEFESRRTQFLPAQP